MFYNVFKVITMSAADKLYKITAFSVRLTFAKNYLYILQNQFD